MWYLALMSSMTPTTYKTRNWSEYNLSLKRRGSLSIWFDPEMAWEATSSGRWGLNKPTVMRPFRPVRP